MCISLKATDDLYVLANEFISYNNKRKFLIANAVNLHFGIEKPPDFPVMCPENSRFIT